jgi:periplasmic protein TonB
MLERKIPEKDLRRSYRITLQSGLIFTLFVMILLFRINWKPESTFDIPDFEQEIVEMEEIEQTQHIETPPPPPRPPVPVEVPNDAIIDEDIMMFDSEFDTGDAFELPPPPADEEEDQEPEIFIAVEQMPDMRGGQEALYAALRYPEMARRAGIEGRVIVQFVVNEQGQVTDPVVLRGIGGGADEAAVDAIKKMSFTPGLQRGRPVKVRMTQPVVFRLQ